MNYAFYVVTVCSLLDGFAQRLAYVYARRLDVINRGLSGYNSEWAIPVFEEVGGNK